ncbi:hypothetical protein [Arthrobacter sp. USHLN218]|uniref:hypothetical protein n=1 Tax=Arthrobacter sp. USHLN218 TaxID=3081232 RepID=UPI00301ABF4D
MAGWVKRTIHPPLAVDVATPEGWERVPVEHTELVAALAGLPAGTFRPSLVVVSYFSDEPLPRIALRAAQEAQRQYEDPLLIASEPLEHAGRPGRRLESTYRIGETTVLVRRWILKLEQRCLDVVASSAVGQVPLVRGSFDAMMASLRWDEAAA